MHLNHLTKLLVLTIALATTGCAFEPVKTGYSRDHVNMTVQAEVTTHDSLLVFRTSGFKLWENQDAEFLVNGDLVGWFKAGGASYLPLQAGKNIIEVREPEHFLKCELEFEFEPGRRQFVEIYERMDPAGLMVNYILADLQSRLMYDPHPGTNCNGLYGLSMGYLKTEQLGDVHREYSFQVVQR